MEWFVLLVAACIPIAWSQRSKPADEVYAIALWVAGSLSALWGFAIAPAAAQLTLGVLALGWLQASSLRI